MKKAFLSASLLLIASLFSLVLFPDSVFAANCGNVKTTVISCVSDTNGVWSLLIIIIRILAAGVGIVAVGAIVYAGFLYATAADNANQLATSKNNIVAVVIGLVLFAGMYSIAEFITPGGAFNRSYSIPVGKEGDNGVNSGGLGSSKDSKGNATDSNIKEARVKIATYNVLGFNHNTSASRYSNPVRMQRAADTMKDAGVDAFVANEINVNEQRNLLLGALSNWGATTRKSGNQDVFIFWNKDVFKLVNSGAYSVPVMPGQPFRPQPWVKLEHKKSKRIIFIYGNHLAQTSHGNNQVTGASATVAKVRDTLKQNDKFVAIVAGDMNTNDRKGYAYNTFKNSGLLTDARRTASSVSGDNCDTHHSLGTQDCRPTRGSHIDHIWVSKKPKATINSYRVIANDETAHISDHNPLIVSLTIPAPKKTK